MTISFEKYKTVAGTGPLPPPPKKKPYHSTPTSYVFNLCRDVFLCLFSISVMFSLSFLIFDFCLSGRGGWDQTQICTTKRIDVRDTY
jgi:hypothetical protein